MINSKIEWTDHTFSPWWGCMKVSDGCKNCYAESLDNRYHHAAPHWGPGSHRKAQSDAYWSQPLKWNEAARLSGVKAKVFCASMADVFEGHQDTIPYLQRLYRLIEKTPHLIWQLLTKRPQNINQLMPYEWGGKFPENVWIGTSVENQQTANERIPELLQVSAIVRFLSCEPLLGPIDLTALHISGTMKNGSPVYGNDDDLHWVIAGGESGQDARPMHPDWARTLRDHCISWGVKFFFKQWGEFRQVGPGQIGKPYKPKNHVLINGCEMVKVGKQRAGRLLDGREWNELPVTNKTHAL